MVALFAIAGCVVAISHNRSLPDRIATHILAFEGESKVTFFDGNFSKYEDWRRQTLGDAAREADQDRCEGRLPCTHVTFQMAEVAAPQEVLKAILERTGWDRL